jgi:hypothetical protein
VPEWEYAVGASWGWDDAFPPKWGDESGFDTPEAAAVAGIPAHHVKVVSVTHHSDGRHAVVDLLIDAKATIHASVGCIRDDSGLWHEAWSSG